MNPSVPAVFLFITLRLCQGGTPSARGFKPFICDSDLFRQCNFHVSKIVHSFMSIRSPAYKLLCAAKGE